MRLDCQILLKSPSLNLLAGSAPARSYRYFFNKLPTNIFNIPIERKRVVRRQPPVMYQQLLVSLSNSLRLLLVIAGSIAQLFLSRPKRRFHFLKGKYSRG